MMRLFVLYVVMLPRVLMVEVGFMVVVRVMRSVVLCASAIVFHSCLVSAPVVHCSHTPSVVSPASAIVSPASAPEVPASCVIHNYMLISHYIVFSTLY